MKYFANAAGGLASIDAGGVANRYTVAHGWVTVDDPTPQSLASMDWWVSEAEARELAHVIDRLPPADVSGENARCCAYTLVPQWLPRTCGRPRGT